MSPKEIQRLIRDQEENGDLQGAFSSALEGNREFPSNMPLAISVARIANKLGEREKSISLYRDLINSAPNSELILGSYLRVLLNLNRIEDAAEEAKLRLPLIQTPACKLISTLALIVLFLRRISGQTNSTLFAGLIEQKLPEKIRVFFRIACCSAGYQFDEKFELDVVSANRNCEAKLHEILTNALRTWWDYEGPTERVQKAYQIVSGAAPHDDKEFWNDFAEVRTEARNGRGPDKNIVVIQALQAARSIAVVGNSGIEIGRGNGSTIEAKDLVVRFNRFSLEPPYDRDYGTKTTIVTLPPNFDNRHIACANCARHLILAGPNTRRKEMEPTMRKFLHENEERISDIPISVYRSLFAALGALPSTGLATLEWIRQLRNGMQGVSVYGFSLIDQIGPHRQSAHYFETAIPTPGHDWQAEYHYFKTYFQISNE